MSNDSKYPTPKEFMMDVPLYKVISYEDEDLEYGRKLYYFEGTFDSYCPDCNSHSIFERHWESHRFVSSDENSWVDCGFFKIAIRCTRNRSHRLFFFFLANGQEIKKVGQFPSIADLNLFDVKKYSKVLEKKYFQEFTKAIGLVSHGIGVGSFVYLRRIFEFLIEESHQRAISHDSWDEELYVRSRMSERIQHLESELPEFLVENKAMYSILSKGIHELSEDECLAAFPVMKVGIEIILDEKIESMKKAKKLEEAKRAIGLLSEKT